MCIYNIALTYDKLTNITPSNCKCKPMLLRSKHSSCHISCSKTFHFINNAMELWSLVDNRMTWLANMHHVPLTICSIFGALSWKVSCTIWNNFDHEIEVHELFWTFLSIQKPYKNLDSKIVISLMYGIKCHHLSILLWVLSLSFDKAFKVLILKW